MTALFLILARVSPSWQYPGWTDDRLRACPIVPQAVVRYCVLIWHTWDGSFVYTSAIIHPLLW